MKNIIVLALCFWAAQAMATPGGVDARGCHQSKKIGEHCHPERAKLGASGESAGERDKRLKRECKGQRNGGACQGYGSAKPDVQSFR